MIGITLALLVSFLKALGDFGGKYFTSSRKTDTVNEYSLGLGIRAISAMMILPYILYKGFPIIPTDTWVLILTTSVGNAIATITMLKALKLGELSIVTPLNALSVPFLLVTSYLIIGETPNTYGLVGVCVIFVGTYLLGAGDIRHGGIFAPIISIFKDTGSIYMVLTAIIMAITGPLDKLGILEFGAVNWLFLTNSCVVMIIAIFMLLTRKTFHAQKITHPKQFIKAIIVAGLWGTGALLQMFAIKYTLVVYVLAFKRASGIFSVILGKIFFHEKNIGWKLFATSIMIAGVAIITLGGNI